MHRQLCAKELSCRFVFTVNESALDAPCEEDAVAVAKERQSLLDVFALEKFFEGRTEPAFDNIVLAI
jgi:hypothetical protein